MSSSRQSAPPLILTHHTTLIPPSMARPPQPEALILPDGRRLEYFVWGPADGFPLVYIHGTPGAGSPARAALLARCAERKIKLITFSRAGYGGSTRHRGRRVVDVVPDVQALLAHLGAGECVVAGESGGGREPFS